MHPLVAALRIPLNLIPPTAQVPILLGPLRGARWIVGSGNHVCWLGLYEFRKQIALKRMIATGGVFYDVGAHVGFHTLLASRLVGPTGRVVAFEPLPRNLLYLRQHLWLNAVSNVTDIGAAAADRTGMEAFSECGTYMGGLDEAGGLQVRTVTIDSLRSADSIPAPDLIKIDVEGGEERVLLGASETLRVYRPIVFLATHGAGLHRNCTQILTELGYEVVALGGGDPSQTDELVAEHPGPITHVKG